MSEWPEFQGRLLQAIARIETSQQAQVEAFRAHEAYEERRLASIERRVDRLEGAGSSQATQALTDAKAALVLQQSRGYGWAKGVVLLLATTIFTAAATLAVSYLLGR